MMQMRLPFVFLVSRCFAFSRTGFQQRKLHSILVRDSWCKSRIDSTYKSRYFQLSSSATQGALSYPLHGLFSTLSSSEVSDVTDEKRKDNTHTLPYEVGQTLSLISELRQSRTSIVDKMGAHALHDPDPSNKDSDFQTLVCLMLSAQTKDVVVSKVMTKLRHEGLSLHNVMAMEESVLRDLIAPVGFCNRKAKFIKDTALILHHEYDGKVPDELKELLKLPGVGPKMAILALQIIHNKVEGISVDTHVHRISRLLGWADMSTAKTPLKTQKQLEALFPREYWGQINLLLVGLGQDIQNDLPKLLYTCLHCSRPKEALLLLTKLGVNVDLALKNLKNV